MGHFITNYNLLEYCCIQSKPLNSWISKPLALLKSQLSFLAGTKGYSKYTMQPIIRKCVYYYKEYSIITIERTPTNIRLELYRESSVFLHCNFVIRLLL